MVRTQKSGGWAGEGRVPLLSTDSTTRFQPIAMDEVAGYQILQNELDSYVAFYKRRCVVPSWRRAATATERADPPRARALCTQNRD